MTSYLPLIVFPVFFLIVTVAWFINTYNRFIKYRNMIEEAWSGIDVALKRRYNLIPNLVRTVRGYVHHEADVMEKESSRFAGLSDVPVRTEEESSLTRSLYGMLALAEDYPDLKASENFISLQKTLSDIEEDIQNARNRYNRAVRRMNTIVESFPSRYIAKKYGFTKANYFSLELATQRELTMVDFSSP